MGRVATLKPCGEVHKGRVCDACNALKSAAKRARNAAKRLARAAATPKVELKPKVEREPRVEGYARSDEISAKISATKKGVKQGAEHLAARKATRKSHYETGDKVEWFGEEGTVVKYLGLEGVTIPGAKQKTYRVRFGNHTRTLIHDVLTKVAA